MGSLYRSQRELLPLFKKGGSPYVIISSSAETPLALERLDLNYAGRAWAFCTTSSTVGGFGGCQLRHRGVRTLMGRLKPSVEK